MADKSGIFSLIDEKKFRYNNTDDDYTYKIEKIFNYENYLFVLFSKLYLKEKKEKDEGDSNVWNHLYLITIEKNGRNITTNDIDDILDTNGNELFNIIKDGTAKLADLEIGKYKNVFFINNESFAVSIVLMTGDDKEANLWARIYRKLENTDKVTFYKLDKKEDKGYKLNSTKVTNSNDYSQFVTFYTDSRNWDQMEVNGFGRIASNIRSLQNLLINSDKIEDENERRLFPANKKYLYNYEYYFDWDKTGDGYVWKLFYYNSRYRDSADTTEFGKTNPYKTFPFREKNYFSGLGYIDIDDKIHCYYYPENTYINDTYFNLDIDDNYLQPNFDIGDPLVILNNLYNYTDKDLNDNFKYSTTINSFYFVQNPIFYLNEDNDVIIKNLFYVNDYNYIHIYSYANFIETSNDFNYKGMIELTSYIRLQLDMDTNNYYKIVTNNRNGNLILINTIDFNIDNLFDFFNIDRSKFKSINFCIIDSRYKEKLPEDFNINNDSDNIIFIPLFLESNNNSEIIDENIYTIKDSSNREVFKLVNKFSDEVLITLNYKNLPYIYSYENNEYHLARKYTEVPSMYFYDENISYWCDKKNKKFKNFLSINNSNYYDQYAFLNDDYYNDAIYGLITLKDGGIEYTTENITKDNGFIIGLEKSIEKGTTGFIDKTKNSYNTALTNNLKWSRNCNFYDVESDYLKDSRIIGNDDSWYNDIDHPYVYNQDSHVLHSDYRNYALNDLFTNLNYYKENEIPNYEKLYDEMVSKFNKLISDKDYLVGVKIPKNISTIIKNSDKIGTFSEDLYLDLMVLPKGDTIDTNNLDKLFKILYYTPYQPYIVPINSLDDVPWISTSNKPLRFIRNINYINRYINYLHSLQFISLFNIDFNDIENYFDANCYITQKDFSEYLLNKFNDDLGITFNNNHNDLPSDKDLYSNFYYYNSNNIWSYNNYKSTVPLGFKVKNFNNDGYDIYYAYNYWINDEKLSYSFDINEEKTDYTIKDDNDNTFSARMTNRIQPVMLSFDYIFDYHLYSSNYTENDYVIKALTTILSLLSENEEESANKLYNLLKKYKIAIRFVVQQTPQFIVVLGIDDNIDDIIYIATENGSSVISGFSGDYETFIKNKDYNKNPTYVTNTFKYHFTYNILRYEASLNNLIPSSISSLSFSHNNDYNKNYSKDNYYSNREIELNWTYEGKDSNDNPIYQVHFPTKIYSYFGKRLDNNKDNYNYNILLTKEHYRALSKYIMRKEDNDEPIRYYLYNEYYENINTNIKFIHCNHFIKLFCDDTEISDLNSYPSANLIFPIIKETKYFAISNKDKLEKVFYNCDKTEIIDDSNSTKNFNYIELNTDTITSYNRDRLDKNHYISFDFHDIIEEETTLDKVIDDNKYNINTCILTLSSDIDYKTGELKSTDFVNEEIEFTNNERTTIDYTKAEPLMEFFRKMMNNEEYAFDEIPDGFNNNFGIEIKRSFYNDLIGFYSNSNICPLCIRYNDVISDFSLESEDDPSWESFFTVDDYAYIPMKYLSNERYVLLTDDSDNDNTKKIERQISVLKNNGIVEFNIDGFINDSTTSDKLIKIYNFLDEDTLKPIMGLKDVFYDENNNKVTLSSEDDILDNIYIVEFRIDDNIENINTKVYLTNSEIEKNDEYTDILNLLDNKTPFYKINTDVYDNKYEEVNTKYKFYSYSVNNKIVITKNVPENSSTSNGYSEIVAILKFDEDFIICGDTNYIIAINKNYNYENNTYKVPLLILDYNTIIEKLFNNLDDKLEDDYKVLFEDQFDENKYLMFKDTLIEDTTIIDDNKSDYYDLENQTVITRNLIDINYAKLYNIYEYENNTRKKEYRLFITINGRVLVSNEIIKLNDTEDINPLMVDFYTINGRVNNIYMEAIDVDNNNLLCIASDKNELYIFDNLFKGSNTYSGYKYENYINKKLTKNCLKYIYNFNNTPLDKSSLNLENIEDRKEFYRETLTPTILNIGSSVDDITICDKYINTLNTEFIKSSETNKVEKVNSIKYFKLADDLSLDPDIINVDGDNNDDNNLFDDSGSYLKLECFKNYSNNFINGENNSDIDKYVMINFRVNIDNKEINENDRYYTLNYQLYSSNGDEINDYSHNGYSLTNNSVIYEMNNIYKNIYIYIPNNKLNSDIKVNETDLSTNNILTYNFLIDIKSSGEFDAKCHVFNNNSTHIYTFPIYLNYNIIDSYFPNETISYNLTNLPKKLTTRDYFVCSITNDSSETINRLYYRWRYIGNKPSDDNYDYYLLSFTMSGSDSNSNNPYNISYYICYILRNYLRHTFDATNTNFDFSINKINFDKDYQWNSINLPYGYNKAKLFNVIIRKNPESDSENWFDDILLEEGINYTTNINLETIKTIEIPYEKIKITYEDYIKFLEYEENTLDTSLRINNGFLVEAAYQPSLYNGEDNINKDINFIYTKNFYIQEDDDENYITINKENQEKLMSNVFKNFIFIPNHDYYFLNDEGYEYTLFKNTEEHHKLFTVINNNFYNPNNTSNIFYNFIKYKFGYENYEDYDNYLWSLILDEEDIFNFKLNKDDASFTVKDTYMRDRWWFKTNNDTSIKWWEDSNYRNLWIYENYMPLNNTIYDEEINLYIKDSFNSGLNYNINSKDIGLINLTEDISNLIHYGIEKRLITGIYIDGLKLFNEGYYFKDSLNNVQNIFINPTNLKSYFANTEKFPFYTNLISLISTAIKPYTDYDNYLQELQDYENGLIDSKPEKVEQPTNDNPTFNIKNILSNIEVNTNFGLISEQEKLIAYIEVRNYDNDSTEDSYIYTEQSNVTKTVVALNDTGAYYINNLDEPNIDDDLAIDSTQLTDTATKTVFTDQLTLIFEDEYLYRIVNSNDRINIYISYRNDIGGKYARRINPKFTRITLDGQNVKLEIKGFYSYKNLSTIYLVTGDINNHNMFFKNIDETIQYIDLSEIKTQSGVQLFKYLSYDNIVSANNVEINMNGYILYPDIDYTIINGEFTTSTTNLVMFRNNIPDTGDISVELNLRPDNDSKIVFMSKQAYSMTKENYNNKEPGNDKKVALSKYITMDNDRYLFLSASMEDRDSKKKEIINKFDLYINNMKVPNKYIEVVNSKTIKLSKNEKDYAIDLHKTHIAKKGSSGLYEITTDYDDTESDSYRYFDPEYENIMIVFQNKFNPYNYEIEIENKYSNGNFNSLLNNLFFKFEDNDGVTLTRTNSCYTPPNETDIYDNFDWICGENKETNLINKLSILTQDARVYNCNKSDLTENVILDGTVIENDIISSNIIIDCNPSVGSKEDNTINESPEFNFDD
jgi:hypothetical protein